MDDKAKREYLASELFKIAYAGASDQQLVVSEDEDVETALARHWTAVADACFIAAGAFVAVAALHQK